ncbi:MAG: bifunctional metallophosphatase/5'-nucleotidase [Spirochaetales bacterium]|nr:bifunctional metallophosphatase/5'-nucleotidase [Spirochaetales bacterium]
MKKKILSLGLAAMAALLLLACQTPNKGKTSSYKAGEAVYTLQLLHFADIDGNEEIAMDAVDDFSALVNAFQNDASYSDSTLVVSSGDNLIPGPRFYAAEQSAVRAVTGSNEPGHADIAFMNYFNVKASAMGNHDLDAGPGEFADACQIESKNGIEFPGSQFPYLSANLDWSTDGDTSKMMGENGLSADELKGKVAAYTYTEVNGEKIGLVGASTPTLDVITSTAGITVLPEDDSIEGLAAEIQKSVDALTAMGINKIILLAHMQQIQIEMALAEMLTDVDVIVAGGSNTRMGDKTDTLYGGDNKFEMNYPYSTASADDKPILVVNVDGDYKYLGRLVVSFDEKGYVVIKDLDKKVNGVYAATPEMAAELGGTPDERVVAVQEAIATVIEAQFGNVLGYTDVYLDGRRSQVRTQETNLGDLTADANLWYANLMGQTPVDLSIKNGGGIRTEIGSAVVPPGSTDYSEAVYNAPIGGGVSEGHLKATLRFDNGLCTLTATAEELVMLLEHAISETAEGATPGKFPQVAGMKLSFDASKEAGSRLVSLDVLNADGSVKDTVVADGALQGDANRTFRLVTLNYLAGGGDGYPYDKLSNSDRRNLYDGKGYGEETDFPDENLSADPGKNSSFSYTGGEQDALAEYLMAFHATTADAFSIEETDRSEDMRIMY